MEGAVALVAAAILLGGAAGTITLQVAGKPTAGDLSLAGAVVVLLVDALLVLFGAFEGDPGRWEWVAGALAVGGSWAVWRLLRGGAKLPRFKRIAFAALLPVIITGGNFAYSDVYLPSVQPHLVALFVHLGDAAIDKTGKVASFPITIDFKNAGKSGVYVLGSTYSVVGRRANAAQLGLSDPNSLLAVQERLEYERSAVVAGYDLLQSGQFIRPGDVFEGSDEASIVRTVSVNLPVGYDTIAIQASAYVIRKDRATVIPDYPTQFKRSWDDQQRHTSNAPPWVAHPGTNWVRFSSPLVEGSLLRRLVRWPRFVTVWWVLALPPPRHPAGFSLRATIAPRGGERTAPSPSRSHQFFVRYGLQFAHTGLIERSALDMKLPATNASP
jgi:hypothetical protein